MVSTQNGSGTGTGAASALAALSNELAEAVSRAGAGVVTVNARRRQPASGIVWEADGLVVTANHVVERDEEITLGLADGRTVDARLVGRDPGTDLALLRTDAGGLEPAARSGVEPRVGHLTLAIGRPGPSGPMASFGAISTVGGPWRTPSGATVDGYLRADVAMLPGFSGGPLVDGAGGVLGLNSSTLGRGGGLTVPNGAIDAVLAALQAHGRVRRGYLGIGTQGVTLPEALVAAHGLPAARALLITTVEGGSPAEQGGLLLGDVIVAVDGATTSEVEQLQDQLAGDKVGRAIALRLVRGGEPRELSVTVGER
jgi:S1-C subfamily serine protease